MICHRNCHALLRFSCDEMMQTSQLKPTFFLAQDNFDQKRWIEGLREIRRAVIKSAMGNDGGSPTSPRTPAAARS